MKKKLLDLLAKKRGIVDRMKQADAANNQTVFESILAENTAVDAEIARVKAIMEAEENVAAPILRRQSRSTAASACMPLRSASAPRHAASVQPLRPMQTFCVVPWQPKMPVP